MLGENAYWKRLPSQSVILIAKSLRCLQWFVVKLQVACIRLGGHHAAVVAEVLPHDGSLQTICNKYGIVSQMVCRVRRVSREEGVAESFRIIEKLVVFRRSFASQ